MIDIKKGVDRQLTRMRLDKTPLLELAIKDFEEMAFEIEMDISTLDEAVFNYLTVSRRYGNDNEIINIPHIH